MAAPARSAAIQIVRPPDTPKVEASDKVSKKDATQRLCRNVLIYGACRFQDQGCTYFHPPPGTDPATLPAAAPPTASTPQPPATPKSTLKATAAPYPTPESKDARPAASGLGAEHLSAPVFVPKTAAPSTETSPQSPALSMPMSATDWANAPPFNAAGIPPSAPMTPSASGPMYEEGGPFESQQPMQPSMDSSMFMGAPTPRRAPEHHLYTSPLPHVAGRQMMHSFFIPDELRRMLQARQEATYANPGASAGLPSEVHVYHNLVPLGPAAAQSNVSRVYHHPGPVYRATSTIDGNVYCLRRIEGFKLSSEQAFAAVETWRQIRHANIVGLREAFTTKAFNDNSLMLVYDFHPDSITIADEWLSPESVQRRRQAGSPVPERVIWSYVIQIANAIKAVHTAGLAIRSLDATKILITGKNRIRINGVGVLDVLAFDNTAPIGMYQQEDLIAFGQLIAALCADYAQPGQHFGQDFMGRGYSLDLKNVAAYLMGKPAPAKSIDEVLRLAGPRILNELDALQTYNDVLETELGSEVENGRIARLLMKLGFINERPEFDMDPQWSESGDRYVLKLFRDYVFHQVGPDGKPVLDLSHVLTTLNKLDAGGRSREKIMLVSRDSQSCLVVEYRDIYKCIESAYNELRNSGKPPRR